MSPRRPSNQDHLDALEFLLRDAAAIAQLADDWAEGFPAGGGEGRGSVGGHSDRTFSDATRGMVDHREDPVTRQQIPTTIARREGHGLSDRLTAILNRLEHAKADLAYARAEWAKLRPSDHDVAEAKARQLDTTRTAGVGHCQVHACDEYCTGGTNDRLKSGLCPKHYMAWWRNLRADEPVARDVFLRTADGCVVTDETAGMRDCG